MKKAKARILPPTPENLKLLGNALRSGELVAMPTETVYGLAASALDLTAVARIFEAKERPTFDPLIVHVPLADRSVAALIDRGLVDAARLSAKARDAADRLIGLFWPGPLTLVLPKRAEVPDLITSGLPTVAIRMPRHPAAQALLTEAGVALAAPSANRFGRISPTSAGDVLSELGDRIQWILEGGRSEIGVESTVAEITPEGRARILRPGDVSVSDIQNRAGIEAEFAVRAMGEAGPQVSPGALNSHYAPAKAFHLLPASIELLSAQQWLEIKKLIETSSPPKIGLLLMRKPLHESQGTPAFSARTGFPEKKLLTRHLSESGSIREIAHRLFSALRELDESEAQLLFAEPCPAEQGLGFAVADRLSRATFRSRAVKSPAEGS